MKLHAAFGVVRGDVIAFVGAGGKTSTLVGLGYELAEKGWRVLATTTTSLKTDQLALFPQALTSDADSETISQALTDDNFVFLYRNVEDNRVYGPDPGHITRLMDAVDSDVLLVEADVSSGLPLKAPFDHEPMMPPETSLVILLASLSALGQPLDEEHVYNVQSIIDRYGFKSGNHIKSPWIAQVLRDEELGLRNISSDLRVVAFLNRTPSAGYGRARARLIARLALRRSRLYGVAIGSVRAAEPVFEVRRPIGAIVLAAGMSTRMGQPKVLLPWTDKHNIIEHIIEQLLNSRLDQIVVVTGKNAAEVKQIVKPLGVQTAYNRSYNTGEMLSSVKAGLRMMPDHVAAALIVLGDQPRIQPRVIYKLLMAYAEGKGEIIIPSFERRRGHPILLSRRYWGEMLNLPRGSSPRTIINAHQNEIYYVNVNTDSVLRDVDTPEDYNEERWRAGLL